MDQDPDDDVDCPYGYEDDDEPEQGPPPPAAVTSSWNAVAENEIPLSLDGSLSKVASKTVAIALSRVLHELEEIKRAYCRGDEPGLISLRSAEAIDLSSTEPQKPQEVPQEEGQIPVDFQKPGEDEGPSTEGRKSQDGEVLFEAPRKSQDEEVPPEDLISQEEGAPSEGRKSQDSEGLSVARKSQEGDTLSVARKSDEGGGTPEIRKSQEEEVLRQQASKTVNETMSRVLNELVDEAIASAPDEPENIPLRKVEALSTLDTIDEDEKGKGDSEAAPPESGGDSESAPPESDGGVDIPPPITASQKLPEESMIELSHAASETVNDAMGKVAIELAPPDSEEAEDSPPKEEAVQENAVISSTQVLVPVNPFPEESLARVPVEPATLQKHIIPIESTIDDGIRIHRNLADQELDHPSQIDLISEKVGTIANEMAAAAVGPKETTEQPGSGSDSQSEAPKQGETSPDTQSVATKPPASGPTNIGNALTQGLTGNCANLADEIADAVLAKMDGLAVFHELFLRFKDIAKNITEYEGGKQPGGASGRSSDGQIRMPAEVKDRVLRTLSDVKAQLDKVKAQLQRERNPNPAS